MSFNIIFYSSWKIVITPPVSDRSSVCVNCPLRIFSEQLVWFIIGEEEKPDQKTSWLLFSSALFVTVIFIPYRLFPFCNMIFWEFLCKKIQDRTQKVKEKLIRSHCSFLMRNKQLLFENLFCHVPIYKKISN